MTKDEAFHLSLCAIEEHLAGCLGAVEAQAEAQANLAANYEKLAELYLRLDDRFDRLEAMLGNYIEATRAERQASIQLRSEVREKLKVAGG